MVLQELTYLYNKATKRTSMGNINVYIIELGTQTVVLPLNLLEHCQLCGKQEYQEEELGDLKA